MWYCLEFPYYEILPENFGSFTVTWGHCNLLSSFLAWLIFNWLRHHYTCIVRSTLKESIMEVRKIKRIGLSINERINWRRGKNSVCPSMFGLTVVSLPSWSGSYIGMGTEILGWSKCTAVPRFILYILQCFWLKSAMHLDIQWTIVKKNQLKE